MSVEVELWCVFPSGFCQGARHELVAMPVLLAHLRRSIGNVSQHALASINRESKQSVQHGRWINWAMVLVVSFRGHARTELGNIEMMKKMEGQGSAGGACGILLNSGAT